MTEKANQLTKDEKVQKPEVSTTLVKSTLYYCTSIGLDADELLKQIEMKAESLADPDGRVLEPAYDLLLHRASEWSNDEFFGLHMGERLTLRQFGILGFLIMSAENIGEALKAYIRFQTTLGESLSLQMEEDETSSRLTMINHGGLLSGQHRVESLIAAVCTACFELSGKKIKPLKLELNYPLQKNTSEYERVAGVEPIRGNQNVIEIHKNDMQVRVLNATAQLRELLESKLRGHLESLKRQMTGRVRTEISYMLSKKVPISIENLAARLEISTRQLQIKLREEGSSFREIYENLQKQLAIEFLGAEHSIAEISYALGFSEPSAFQRAFKKWTGQSPAFFRSVQKKAPAQ